MHGMYQEVQHRIDEVMEEAHSPPRNEWYTDERTGLRKKNFDNFKCRSDILNAAGKVVCRAGQFLGKVTVFEGRTAGNRTRFFLCEQEARASIQFYGREIKPLIKKPTPEEHGMISNAAAALDAAAGSLGQQAAAGAHGGAHPSNEQQTPQHAQIKAIKKLTKSMHAASAVAAAVLGPSQSSATTTWTPTQLSAMSLAPKLGRQLDLRGAVVTRPGSLLPPLPRMAPSLRPASPQQRMDAFCAEEQQWPQQEDVQTGMPGWTPMLPAGAAAYPPAHQPAHSGSNSGSPLRVASLDEGMGFGPPRLDQAVEPVFPVLAQDVSSTPMLCRTQPRHALEALQTAADLSVSSKLAGQKPVWSQTPADILAPSPDDIMMQQAEADVPLAVNLEAMLTRTSTSGVHKGVASGKASSTGASMLQEEPPVPCADPEAFNPPTQLPTHSNVLQMAPHAADSGVAAPPAQAPRVASKAAPGASSAVVRSPAQRQQEAAEKHRLRMQLAQQKTQGQRSALDHLSANKNSSAACAASPFSANSEPSDRSCSPSASMPPDLPVGLLSSNTTGLSTAHGGPASSRPQGAIQDLDVTLPNPSSILAPLPAHTAPPGPPTKSIGKLKLKIKLRQGTAQQTGTAPGSSPGRSKVMPPSAAAVTDASAAPAGLLESDLAAAAAAAAEKLWAKPVIVPLLGRLPGDDSKLRLSPSMITSRGNHSTTYTGKIESAYRDIICKTVEVYKADCPLDLTDKASCIMRSLSAFAESNPGCYSITAAPRYGKVQQHFTLPVGRSAHICIMYDHNLGTSLQQLLVSTPGAVTEALVRASAELMLELVRVQGNPDLPLCITEHKFNTGKLFVDAAEVAGSNGSQSRTAGVGIACSSSGGCGSRMRFAGYSGCRIQQRGAPLQPACDTTAAAAGASTGLPATGQHIFPASSMPDIEQIPHVLVELAVAGCLSPQEPSSNGQRRSSGSSMQHTPQQQTQQAHAQQDPATAADLQLFLMGGPFSDALQERMAGCFAAGWTSGKLQEVRGFIVDCLAAATAGTGSAAQHLTAWALLQHPWLGGSSEQLATAQAVAAAGVQQEHGEPDLEDNCSPGASGRVSLPAPLAESVTKNDQNMGQGVGWHQSAGGTVQARTETACAAVAAAVGGSQKDKENKSPGVRDDSWKRPAGQAAAAAGDGQEGDENRGELKGILKKQPGPGKSPETKRRQVVTLWLPPPPEKKQQP